MTRALMAAVALVLPAAGQEMMNYSFHLDNGALVLYQTYSPVRMTDKAKAFGTATAAGDVIRRTLLDANGNPWLAFELHIDRKPGPGPVRFVLSMEPLGGWAFFRQKPAPREIANGDRVLLDVLEQPDTGRKIYDTFAVGINVPMQGMPLPSAIPQMPPPGAMLRIEGPQLRRVSMNDRTLTASSTEVATGTQISLTVPKAGRFTFSTRPEPGFRMEAIADRSRLEFVSGQYMFDVHCAHLLIEPPGTWYLWVRHEPAPQGRNGLPNLDLVIP
jgi:hypothetical protein